MKTTPSLSMFTRLKKIELFGFKSFAKKTKCIFEGPLTAIVGPNGCGKSNIIDAFRWVLGEQSAKSMRGQQMSDVIFSGTEKRKSSHLAFVSLVFDNTDGYFPHDFTELCISRKVFSNGDAHYLLNGRVARLKDIQNLLFGSGLGKVNFAVLEQGKVEEVIMQSAEQRRLLFEEVAGIARFRQRKKEAEGKLHAAERNLKRVEDIQKEVQRQTQEFEKQAVVTRKYNMQKQELHSLHAALFYSKWNELKNEQKENLSQQKKLEEKLIKKKSSLKELKEQLFFYQQEFSQSQKEMQSLEKSHAKLESKLTIHDAQLRSHHSQQRDLTQEKKEAELKKKAFLKEVQELRKQIQALQKPLEKLKKTWSCEKAKLESLDQEREKLELIAEEKDKEEERVKGEVKKLQRLCVDEQRLVFEKKRSLDLLQERVSVLEKDMQSLDESIEQTGELSEIKSKQVQDLEKELLGKQECLDKLESNLAIDQKSLELEEKSLKSQQQQLNAYEAEKQILEKHSRSFHGFSKGSKDLLNNLESLPLLSKKEVRPLAQSMDLSSKELEQYSCLWSKYEHTILVKSIHDLNLLLAFCEKKKITDLSFFLLGLSSFRRKLMLLFHFFIFSKKRSKFGDSTRNSRGKRPFIPSKK